MKYERVVPPGFPVVAFVGDPGQGKDTACRLFKAVARKRFAAVERYAFADTLKDATRTLFPTDPHPWTRRALWNAVGDAARMVDPDTFVKSVEASIMRDHAICDAVVVTDARFSNEFAWLDAQGATYVGLCRQPEDGYLTDLEDAHPSAHGWQNLLAMRSNINWCPNYTEADTTAWLEQFVDIMGWFDGSSDDSCPHCGNAIKPQSQPTD